MKKEETIIRQARQDDCPALARIYNHYVTETTVSFETEPVTAEEMGHRMAGIQACYPYLVAEQGGMVVGYAYVHPWKERRAYHHTLETTVYLAPDCRHHGVGRRLVEQLIEQCKATDAHTLIACITAENEESLHFHEQLGFRRVSLFREVGRKFGRWLDVVDMELLLHGEP